MNKVQLSLTNEEVSLLSSYGSQFGYSLPKTIRFVISKAAESFLQSGLVPTFAMRTSTEHAGLQALAEHQAGKTTVVDNVADFIEQL